MPPVASRLIRRYRRANVGAYICCPLRLNITLDSSLKITLRKVRPDPDSRLINGSQGLTEFSQVDMLVVRYTFDNFGAGKSPGSPDW
jgi:hypothetical protein